MIALVSETHFGDRDSMFHKKYKVYRLDRKGDPRVDRRR